MFRIAQIGYKLRIFLGKQEIKCFQGVIFVIAKLKTENLINLKIKYKTKSYKNHLKLKYIGFRRSGVCQF